MQLRIVPCIVQYGVRTKCATPHTCTSSVPTHGINTRDSKACLNAIQNLQYFVIQNYKMVTTCSQAYLL